MALATVEMTLETSSVAAKQRVDRIARAQRAHLLEEQRSNKGQELHWVFG
jgi:hypothetical protein